MADEHPYAIEYRGVRVDLEHVDPTSRGPMLLNAQAWIDADMRPPILTVHASGVDVSERPDLWPARVRDYRGLGRLEWVGLPDEPNGARSTRTV